MARDPALAKIHMGKKALGLEDADYRALLARVAGVDSAARLDAGGKARVLAEFARLGWKPSLKDKPKISDKPGVRLVFGLWSELGRMGVVGGGRGGLYAFVKRQTGVDNPEWLKAGDLNKVIEGLKAMRDRARPA